MRPQAGATTTTGSTPASTELEVLFEEPFVVAVPGDHELAGRAEITLADLDGVQENQR